MGPEVKFTESAWNTSRPQDVSTHYFVIPTSHITIDKIRARFFLELWPTFKVKVKGGIHKLTLEFLTQINLYICSEYDFLTLLSEATTKRYINTT